MEKAQKEKETFCVLIFLFFSVRNILKGKRDVLFNDRVNPFQS